MWLAVHILSTTRLSHEERLYSFKRSNLFLSLAGVSIPMWASIIIRFCAQPDMHPFTSPWRYRQATDLLFRICRSIYLQNEFLELFSDAFRQRISVQDDIHNQQSTLGGLRIRLDLDERFPGIKPALFDRQVYNNSKTMGEDYT